MEKSVLSQHVSDCVFFVTKWTQITHHVAWTAGLCPVKLAITLEICFYVRNDTMYPCKRINLLCFDC